MHEDDVVIFSVPFTPTPHSGSGVDRYTYELINNFPDTGKKIRVISNAPGNKMKRTIISGSKVVYGTILKKPKLFHAISPISARLLFNMWRKPVITTVHDVIYLDWRENWPNLEPLRHKYNILSILKSDKLIVPFEYTKNRIQQEFGIDDKKIEVVNYGIDLSRFYDVSRNVGSEDSKSFDVTFMGGVNPLSRGGEIVLQIYSKLISRNPSYRLAISGIGPQMEVMKKKASQMGILGKVEWNGFIPEDKMARFINATAVLLYPSFMGFSYLLMQSMASGVPIVAANLFDIPEFIGNAGVVCDLDDIGEYVDSIIVMLSDLKMRDEFIKRGLQKVRSLSPRRMSEQTNSVYIDFIEW